MATVFNPGVIYDEGKFYMYERAAGGLRPFHCYIGMLESKDPAGFLTPLAPLAADLHAVAIGGHAALSAEQAAEAARKAGLTATAKDSVTAALAAILAAGERRPGRILICGSLYLAGLVLAENG